MNVAITLLIPVLGTVVGASTVLMARKAIGARVNKALLGFAAGVMVAASVWSLIIPAMNQSAHMGKLAFIPALVGVWLGFLALLALDSFVPHLHIGSDCPEGVDCGLGKNSMMVMAVALHNLPEGMAVGAVAAGWLAGSENVSAAAALAIAVGIAIQNIPEGAIISMPLKSGGMKGRFLLTDDNGVIYRRGRWRKTWDGEELAKGVMLYTGAARTRVFFIVPERSGLTPRAKSSIDAGEIPRIYASRRKELADRLAAGASADMKSEKIVRPRYRFD